jgi:hypothetical protein
MHADRRGRNASLMISILPVMLGTLVIALDASPA